jgi:hypothetical protein
MEHEKENEFMILSMSLGKKIGSTTNQWKSYKS